MVLAQFQLNFIYTCCNMDEMRKHFGKLNKPDTNTVWFHLYAGSKMGQFMETERRIVVTRVLGRGEWVQSLSLG